MRRGTELDGIPEPGKTETGRYLYQGAAPMSPTDRPPLNIRDATDCYCCRRLDAEEQVRDDTRG